MIGRAITRKLVLEFLSRAGSMSTNGFITRFGRKHHPLSNAIVGRKVADLLRRMVLAGQLEEIAPNWFRRTERAGADVDGVPTAVRSLQEESRG